MKDPKHRRARTVLWSIFAVVALAAMILGPVYLAQEMYGTQQPTRGEVSLARFIIGGAILAPFAVLLARMWWRSRGTEAAWVRRRTEERVDDPSKRSRIDGR